jgi:hypothetical protein
MLRTNSPALVNLGMRSTVDTALEIYQHLRCPTGGFGWRLLVLERGVSHCAFGRAAIFHERDQARV